MDLFNFLEEKKHTPEWNDGWTHRLSKLILNFILQKMPLLNNSSRPVVFGMEGDRGLENLGFEGSSASLIQEPRVDTSSSSSTPMTASLDERQKTLVENTWKTLEKNTELYGSIMFAK